MAYYQGEPVEVTLENGTKRFGRYKMHYPQYDHHEVAFADGTNWIGREENVRRPSDDEVIVAGGKGVER